MPGDQIKQCPKCGEYLHVSAFRSRKMCDVCRQRESGWLDEIALQEKMIALRRTSLKKVMTEIGNGERPGEINVGEWRVIQKRSAGINHLDIGAGLGVSEETVRVIEDAGMAKLATIAAERLRVREMILN